MTLSPKTTEKCPGTSKENNYLLTESEVFTGKSQTETSPYWPSDSRQYSKADV